MTPIDAADLRELSLAEAARVLACSRRTLALRFERGEFTTVRRTDGGQWRITLLGLRMGLLGERDWPADEPAQQHAGGAA